MNKAVILKIVGIAVVSLLVLTVVMYFLYPYLNPDKYEQVVTEQETMALQDTSLAAIQDAAIDTTAMVRDSIDARVVMDSLIVANQELKKQLAAFSRKDSIEKATLATVETEAIPEEKFADRVKSLLNLEEDKLGPIVSKMSNNQLVRLYKGSSNIQREKLLRSLSSDRAAKLMTEIML